MSSEYYLNMKIAYEGFRNNVIEFQMDLVNCSIDFNNDSSYIEELIVDKEPIDKGELSSIATSIANYSEQLSVVIAECNRMIEEYEALYQEALYREQMEALAAQDGGQDNADDGMEAGV